MSRPAQTVQFTARRASTPPCRSRWPLTACTIVVLDDSSGLKVDAVTDAAGSSKIMPKGAISAGFGGTAPRPPANPAPWLMMIAAGALLTAAALARLHRLVVSRRA